MSDGNATPEGRPDRPVPPLVEADWGEFSWCSRGSYVHIQCTYVGL